MLHQKVVFLNQNRYVSLDAESPHSSAQITRFIFNVKKPHCLNIIINKSVIYCKALFTFNSVFYLSR